MQGWLAAARVAGFGDAHVAGRKLRACMVARNGWGVIFLDAADGADERRYSLAHELAHFLMDYWWPRERVIAALGPGVAPALDGLRPATAEERLNALFAGVKVGGQEHLMERGPDESIVSARVLAAEDAADRLALELLAPAEEARRRIGNAGAEAGEVLRAAFGLPQAAARAYGAFLRESGRKEQSMREWLGA